MAAAVGAQLALGRQVWGATGPLRVRMGLHTGSAELRGGDYFGPVLNRTARLMAAGHGGQVLCSQVTADLARDVLPDGVRLVDLGEHRLRDLGRPERLYQVTHAELPHGFPPLRSLDAYRSNLPQELSRFVGRGQAVAAVGEALGAARIVSIVGVGGVGKTRLAMRVGAEVMARFADGVWLCELASVRDPALVAEAVATALGCVPGQGLSTGDGLVRFLAYKELLLILDNCEHLVDGVAALVVGLLEAAPGLSVLATSREPLGVRGERLSPLASLELPADDDPTSVVASEAGALFVLRAGEARGDFAVTAENAATVRELCVHLDGIALGDRAGGRPDGDDDTGRDPGAPGPPVPVPDRGTTDQPGTSPDASSSDRLVL